jgi:ribosomal-protein-alanine N-acetyltransferase
VTLTRTQTRRLRGRAPQAGDEVLLARLLQEPAVAATLGGVRDDAQVAEILERGLTHWEHNGFGLWMWFDADDRFVGRGGLSRLMVGGAEEIEAGWSVVHECWNQGYATEMGAAAVSTAFNAVRLGEIISLTLPHNRASRRVMEKLGFSYERDVEYASLPHVLYRLVAPIPSLV